MMFLNEYEIEEMKLRLDPTDTPNLAAGAQALYLLMQWTNENSDGWPYWSLPAKAAHRLMELLQAADRFDPRDCSEAELRKACTPIKAFLTKRGVDHAAIFAGR